MPIDRYTDELVIKHDDFEEDERLNAIVPDYQDLLRLRRAKAAVTFGSTPFRPGRAHVRLAIGGRHTPFRNRTLRAGKCGRSGF